MLITPVESSNIARIAWAYGALYVEFHHGGVYSYADADEGVYHEMKAAASAGKFFHAEVKPKYVAARLDASQASALGFTERIPA